MSAGFDDLTFGSGRAVPPATILGGFASRKSARLWCAADEGAIIAALAGLSPVIDDRVSQEGVFARGFSHASVSLVQIRRRRQDGVGRFRLRLSGPEEPSPGARSDKPRRRKRVGVTPVCRLKCLMK
jgi:hypothetical protein